MSAYGPYAGANDTFANGDGAQQQRQSQQGNPQFRPPIAPAPSGYSQTPNPQNFGSPSLDNQRYGGITPQTIQSPNQPGQNMGYFPPQGPQGSGVPASMNSLTSQMGGMGLGGGEGHVPARTGKKRDRHAYHNIEQNSIATEAFNQSMGNAPQLVNQEVAQVGHQSHPYAGQPFSPSLNQSQSKIPQPAFSPGLQAPGQGPQLPPPVTPGVSAQGRVDPEQIPSIPRQRDTAAQYYLNHLYSTMEMHIPPPGAIPFVAADQGNSSPKFARLTLNNIPASSDALNQTGLPLGLVLQPLASLQAGETPVPVLDFGDLGPPRCRRCRAYINPFMIFRAGGNKVACNMCTFPNDVSAEYFAPTDPSGVRVDRVQRPELTNGTVEYLVPKEYWAKEPVGLRWLFVLDVSQDAVSKGFLAAICAGISKGLYGEDEDAAGEEATNGDTASANRILPEGCKVGFVTFDKAISYFNCNVSRSCFTLLQIDMLMPSRRNWTKLKCL